VLNFRRARKADIDLLFNWANDPITRQNSYNKNLIKYEDHIQWFNKQLMSANFFCYIFSNEDKAEIGQVKIQRDVDNLTATIGISVDKDHRGNGYATEMIQKTSEDFIQENPEYIILACIFMENKASLKSFLKAGYRNVKESIIENIPSFILHYSKINNAGH
jgi:RimJ/RimL family protein N-acetyltransferase